MNSRHRFNVFGRIVDIERAGALWKTEQYLFDLFHEDATPGNGDVRRIA